MPKKQDELYILSSLNQLMISFQLIEMTIHYRARSRNKDQRYFSKKDFEKIEAIQLSNYVKMQLLFVWSVVRMRKKKEILSWMYNIILIGSYRKI